MNRAARLHLRCTALVAPVVTAVATACGPSPSNVRALGDCVPAADASCAASSSGGGGTRPEGGTPGDGGADAAPVDASVDAPPESGAADASPSGLDP